MVGITSVGKSRSEGSYGNDSLLRRARKTTEISIAPYEGQIFKIPHPPYTIGQQVGENLQGMVGVGKYWEYQADGKWHEFSKAVYPNAVAQETGKITGHLNLKDVNPFAPDSAIFDPQRKPQRPVRPYHPPKSHDHRSPRPISPHPPRPPKPPVPPTPKPVPPTPKPRPPRPTPTPIPTPVPPTPGPYPKPAPGPIPTPGPRLPPSSPVPVGPIHGPFPVPDQPGLVYWDQGEQTLPVSSVGSPSQTLRLGVNAPGLASIQSNNSTSVIGTRSQLNQSLSGRRS